MASSHENRDAQALKYIRAHGVDGLSITREQLELLFVQLEIPLERLAEWLTCHEEVLARKAMRWGFHVTGVDQYGKRAPPLLSPGMEHRRKVTSKIYGDKIAVAKQFIAERGLDKRNPSHDELEYLYIKLGLPRTILDSFFKDRAGFLLHGAGIEKRSAAEQRLLAYDASFFQTWTPESAWVVGLIYTDGTLSNNTVVLSSIDEELIRKVQVLINPELRVRWHRQSYDRNQFIMRLTLSHSRIVDALVRLGLTTRKSLTMVFPEVPELYMRHFVRGCWDGDGGFTARDGKLVAHYTCGSRKFIERLAIELFKAGVVRDVLKPNASETNEEFQRLRATYGDGPYPPTIYKRRNANAYDLRIGLRRALEKLYDFLYKDVEPAIYLARKHAIIKRHIFGRNESSSS